MAEHLSQLALEEQALGEGPPNAHLPVCAKCRLRVSALAEESARLRATPEHATARARLEVLAAGLPRKAAPGWRWLLSLGVAAGIAALALLWSGREPSPLLGVKGSATVSVVRAAGGEPTHVARPGDRVALQLGNPGFPWVLVLALGNEGRADLLWPAGENRSGPAPTGAAIVLSPELAITPGSFTVIALFSARPLALAEAQRGRSLPARGRRGLSSEAVRVQWPVCVEGERVPGLALTALAALAAGSAAAPPLWSAAEGAAEGLSVNRSDGTWAAPARRFALVVGENRGDPQDEPLRYAQTDARMFLEAMEEVGQVAPSDALLLVGAQAEDVRRALAALGTRLAVEGRPGDQLLLYVSSHADEGELHLRGTRLGLGELTGYLKSAPVAVAILVLDSCRSGAVTRAKGLTPVSGPVVSVEVPQTRGRVILAASGADEYAQESEALHGSYFTHHFLAGLRGAADLSRDGEVRLEEAYAYAYARTVESTFATRAGVQHPSYALDLSGRGQLVLSHIGLGTSRLRIEVSAPGAWLVTPLGGHGAPYQLEKLAGPVTFALPPGDYRVSTRLAGGVAEAMVSVPAGDEATVREQDLGGGRWPVASAKGSAAQLTLGLFGGSVEQRGQRGRGPAAGWRLVALGDARPLLGDCQPGGGGGLLCARGSERLGRARSGAHRRGRRRTAAGRGCARAEAGRPRWRHGTAPGAHPAPSPRTAGLPFAGALVEGALRLGSPLCLLLSGFAGPELVNDAPGLRVKLRLYATLALGWSL